MDRRKSVFFVGLASRLNCGLGVRLRLPWWSSVLCKQPDSQGRLQADSRMGLMILVNSR